MTKSDIKKATVKQLKGELKSCLNIALNIQEEIENRDYAKIHKETFKF